MRNLPTPAEINETARRFCPGNGVFGTSTKVFLAKVGVELGFSKSELPAFYLHCRKLHSEGSITLGRIDIVSPFAPHLVGASSLEDVLGRAAYGMSANAVCLR